MNWIDEIATQTTKRKAQAWEEYRQLVGRSDLSKAEQARIAILISELGRPVEQVRKDARLMAELMSCAETAKTKEARQNELEKVTTATDDGLAAIQRQREALDATERDLLWQLETAKVSFQEAVAAERRRDSLLVDWRKSIGMPDPEPVRPAREIGRGDPFAVQSF